MTFPLDLEAVQAAFAQPACDGRFDPDFTAYLNELGASRPSVVLAFPPKAAGTFFRSACVAAVQGNLVRTVHAQGGRDASFYLPAFLNYYTGNFPPRPMVTHVHMQALPANRHFIDALGLKPVIMLRPIPDMLASYWDMLDGDWLSPDNWLNVQVPAQWSAMPDVGKAEFMLRMVVPWYASYYATWIAYAAAAPGRVLVLDYDGFRADPVAALERTLAHAGLPCARETCRAALDAVWEQRGDFRFNRGVAGRGAARFTKAQILAMRALLDFYPQLADVAERLIPPLSDVSRAPSAAA